MKAQFKSIRQLLGRRGFQFEVPDYQRGFEWEEKHLEDLWNDLQRIENGINFHYFGNIILRQKESSDKYEIVDGQQRLITLSLLMMAIRDSSAIDVENDRRFDDILYCYESNVRERKIIYKDKNEFDAQFNSIWNREPSNAEGPIKNSYEYYKNRIEDLSEERLDLMMAR